MDICVYYDKEKNNIIDIFPNNINPNMKNNIMKLWGKTVCRKILCSISENNQSTITSLAASTGHSLSTIHENLKLLENVNIVKSELKYEKKKQRIITSDIIFITANPKFKQTLKKFFQGLWYNNKATEKIITFLHDNQNKTFTAEQISIALKIPVDDVKLYLSNWDSLTTRGLSNILKDAPFEKIITYKGK